MRVLPRTQPAPHLARLIIWLYISPPQTERTAYQIITAATVRARYIGFSHEGDGITPLIGVSKCQRYDTGKIKNRVVCTG